MKQTVYESDFIDAFKAIRPDNFSYQGLRVLFEMLTDYENDCGEELELDVIAICCDYIEMNLDDFMREYGLDDDQLDSRNTIQAYLEEQDVWFKFVHSEFPAEGWDHWTVIFWSAS